MHTIHKKIKPIFKPLKQEQGLSLLGLIFWGGLIAAGLFIGMQCVPVVTEYQAIKKAVGIAKSAGDSNAIRNSFDDNVRAGYIDSLRGRDLVIEGGENSGITTVKFNYKKEIHLAGPLSLLFNFSGEEIVR